MTTIVVATDISIKATFVTKLREDHVHILLKSKMVLSVPNFCVYHSSYKTILSLHQIGYHVALIPGMLSRKGRILQNSLRMFHYAVKYFKYLKENNEYSLPC